MTIDKSAMKVYRKKNGQFVTAIQLDFEEMYEETE